jgi:preprotein translocase subunit SecG
MITFLLVFVHVVVCLVLIAVVLLQTGKRADLAGAFGGGGSQTAFGTRGAATILSKLTTTFAVIFMLTSIGLSISAAHKAAERNRSVLDEVSAPASAPTETDPAQGSTVPPADPATQDDVSSDPATSESKPDDPTE